MPLLSCSLPTATHSPTIYPKSTHPNPPYPQEIRPSPGRGWGLFAARRLPAGTFFGEYLGEILTDGDAEKRKGADGYLYDIDFHLDRGGGQGGGPREIEGEGEEPLFVIDARMYANATRFLNHGCEPNAEPVMVLWDSLHPELARVAFFTTRVRTRWVPAPGYPAAPTTRGHTSSVAHAPASVDSATFTFRKASVAPLQHSPWLRTAPVIDSATPPNAELPPLTMPKPPGAISRRRFPLGRSLFSTTSGATWRLLGSSAAARQGRGAGGSASAGRMGARACSSEEGGEGGGGRRGSRAPAPAARPSSSCAGRRRRHDETFHHTSLVIKSSRLAGAPAAALPHRISSTRSCCGLLPGACCCCAVVVLWALPAGAAPRGAHH